jgi:hypothetical protein
MNEDDANDWLFVSDQGWTMTVPEGWEELPISNLPTVTPSKPVVLANSNDWDLSITWMRRESPVEPNTPLQEVFPPIGEFDEVKPIRLANGVEAIETTETYESGESQPHRGYQLILWNQAGKRKEYQRLCFYAPEVQFDKLLPTVRRCARTFRY